MVKHPKKPNQPQKPDPEDSKKNDNPPIEPSISDQDKSHTANQVTKLFWLRVALAVIAGSAATFVFEPIEGEERRWASIAFMIIIFFASIIFAKTMRIQLPSSDKKKIVTTGIGSYIFIYLFMWILTYTLVNIGSVESGIPTPFT